jgi:uncharacterized repeat protein (TIGR03803 family)
MKTLSLISSSLMLKLVSRVLAAVVVFASPAAHAQTETVIYNFGSSATDGLAPFGGITVDPQGNLYGTTSVGGLTPTAGTVYEISAGVEKILWNFSGKPDGAEPYAGVVRDPEGNLFGTTLSGGAHNLGTVFEITASGTEKILASFDETNGASPMGGLIRAANGNMYGLTSLGGKNFLGTIYEINPSGTLTVLYSFKGPPSDGALPEGQLVMDKSGNLFGTTLGGGTGSQGYCQDGCGTVFEYSASGTESVLYNFTGGTDGGVPVGGSFLDVDSSGTLYGIASGGGTVNSNCNNGCGVVFKLVGSVETVLHSFQGGTTDGASPSSGVFRDPKGDLYGTTVVGGTDGDGVIYEVPAAGAYRVLHDFSGEPNDGASPYAGLTPDGKGGAYGTTLGGGKNNAGTVYRTGP